MNEQLWKHDRVEWRFPSALEPRPEPIWLVILGFAAVTALVLQRERAS